ncbi:amidase [Segnochrobactraceae bacterium EtOH-i3]
MSAFSYTTLANAFLTGASSPSAFLEACLARIDAREAEVAAFVVLDIEAARAAARASDARWKAGTPLSPVDGMPVGVKDIIETADFPTGQGSPMWEGFTGGRDAATVAALKEAGAIILGKTTTTEFASSPTFATTTNPHDPTRTPGGSSSGSTAAVGAGFVPMALGSQVVGSTLRPSSFCGCVGFKPSVGGLNRGGSYDYLSHSCVGIIGTALEDVWLTSKAIASRVGGDPGHVGLTGPVTVPGPVKPRRLLLLETDGWNRATPGALAAFEAVVEGLSEAGIDLVDRTMDPALDAFEWAIGDIRTLSSTILSWEHRWPLNGHVARNAGQIHPVTLERFSEARVLTQGDYAEALLERQELRDAFAALMDGVDGAVTLAATGAAPVGLTSTGDPGFNMPASMLGVPALTLPLLSDAGMPLGLQLIGRQNEDAELFRLAAWVTAWHAARV